MLTRIKSCLLDCALWRVRNSVWKLDHKRLPIGFESLTICLSFIPTPNGVICFHQPHRNAFYVPKCFYHQWSIVVWSNFLKIWKLHVINGLALWIVGVFYSSTKFNLLFTKIFSLKFPKTLLNQNLKVSTFYMIIWQLCDFSSLLPFGIILVKC